MDGEEIEPVLYDGKSDCEIAMEQFDEQRATRRESRSRGIIPRDQVPARREWFSSAMNWWLEWEFFDFVISTLGWLTSGLIAVLENWF